MKLQESPTKKQDNTLSSNNPREEQNNNSVLYNTKNEKEHADCGKIK